MIGFIAFVAAFIIHHVGRPIRHPIDHPLLFRRFPQIVPLMIISIGVCWLVVLWSILSYAYYEMNFNQIITLFFVSIFWCISVILIAPSIIPFLAKIYSGNGRLAEWGAFFSGAALGPISFLFMFSAVDIARGLAGARLWGAIVGTLSIYSLYGYFADSSPSPPGRQSVQQQQPVLPRQPSGPAFAPAPDVARPPAPPPQQIPNSGGVIVRSEQFGDWNFRELSHAAGNRTCLIHPVAAEATNSSLPEVVVGWNSLARIVVLSTRSPIRISNLLSVTIDEITFNLRYYEFVDNDRFRWHHYIFPDPMIHTFSYGNTMVVDGIRYSLRGSLRAYAALAACINGRS